MSRIAVLRARASAETGEADGATRKRATPSPVVRSSRRSAASALLRAEHPLEEGTEAGPGPSDDGPARTACQNVPSASGVSRPGRVAMLVTPSTPSIAASSVPSACIQRRFSGASGSGSPSQVSTSSTGDRAEGSNCARRTS